MHQYDIYKACEQALLVILPQVMAEVIIIQSKLDALPDYPSQKEVHEATGYSMSEIQAMLSDGTLTPVKRHHTSRRRIDKRELKQLMIGSSVRKIKQLRQRPVREQQSLHTTITAIR